jgi:hypothetical protein
MIVPRLDWRFAWMQLVEDQRNGESVVVLDDDRLDNNIVAGVTIATLAGAEIPALDNIICVNNIKANRI